MAQAATAATAGTTFDVTSTNDAVDASASDGLCRTAAGTCTLRAAIQQANASPGTDTILVPGGTYELAIPPLNQNLADVGDLDITDSVVIHGAGAGTTIVDGGTPPAGSPLRIHGLDRLFEVAVDDGSVAFSDLTIQEGWAAEYGGAIMNSSSATVTVVDATLTRNGAGKTGGAIDNHLGGTVEVEDSTLTDNYAAESGSALNNNRGGTLSVTNSVVSSNSAADAGLDDALVGAGAIANDAELGAHGTITVTGSRISENRAGGGRNGAAISNDGAGTVSVTGTTFASNRSEANGGAIFNVDGEVTITASKFSENASGADGGAVASSGLGFLNVTDTTFTKNTASDWGGAIQNGNKGSVSIRSSSFTENTGLNGGGFGNEGSGLVTVESSTFVKNAAIDTATAVGGEGGGMHSNSGGEVVVTGGVFTENRALSGGGLSNEGGGRLTITGTRFAANRADEAGGGILIQSGGVRMVDIDVIGNQSESRLEGGGGISYAGDKVVSVGETAAIESSRIRDNTAKGDGGGIDSRGDGPLVVTTTTIAGNTALIGGAVHHVGDAPLAITRSTLSGNVAENGAGLFTDGDGETTVENTTVSGNRAAQFGGGFLVSSRLVVRNSTVTANSAAAGGGINNGGGDLVGDGTVFLANTILASNPGSNCAGTMTSRGGNAEGTDTCQLRELSDQPGTNPQLGPLASNGGPTQTHALLADSPAQDRAVCTELDPCPPVDQRGDARPVFAGFDAGAYESELAPSGGGATQPCSGRTERPVPPDYDSWISQSTPGSNFGGDSILKVKSQGGSNERALVHFTLPPLPPGCKLVGASLRLYSSAATDGRTLAALRIAAGWDEFAVTWGNQPATAGAAATAPSGLDVREWDVLAQTLDMYALGNHGFLLRDTAESQSGEQSFHSSEKGADRPPDLILVFDDPDALATPGLCSTSPLSLSADRDSWVSQSSPSNNFGTDSTLKVKSQSGSNSRALLRFPLPALPSGCTGIASATLRVDVSSGKDGRTLEVRRVTSGWSEAGVTWGNQPATAGPAATVASGEGLIEWEVTPQLLAIYGSVNEGFMIRDAEENGVGEEQTISGRVKVNDGPPELLLRFDDSTPETTIAGGPISPTEESEATFTFSSDRADATFECALDSGAFSACASPHTVSGLALGGHVLEVRATRPIRAVDPTPASYGWSVVDLTPPVVTLSGPTGETEETSATFTFSADETSTLACFLDGIAVANCVSPRTLTALGLGPHAFEVEATDASGNVGSASVEWTVVDLTAPAVTLTGPSAETESRSAELVFSASEPADFACSLNGLEVVGCASPHTLGDLSMGAYVFAVSATDPSGNVGTATHVWSVVDLTPPTVTIGGPPDGTEERSAVLTFSASEAATFACRFDGVAVPACASPLSRSGLGLGPHTLEVEAADPSGNVGTASYTWTVFDRTPPVVSISGPIGDTEERSAALTFTASEAATFECRLDGAAFVACPSGSAAYAGLELGSHTFAVRATDPSGNTGAGAHSWRVVDMTAPAVSIEGPAAETELRSASFTFSANEPAQLRCRLDSAPLADCSTGSAEYVGLALGTHTFEVEATDASGNTGSAAHGWKIVDLTAPVVAVTGPNGETEVRGATIGFSADEPATFSCLFNGVDVLDCASPHTLSDLELGSYVFEVSATDPSGNTGSSSIAWSVVDRTPPVVTLTGPPAETEDRSAQLGFSASEPATLACTFDGVAVPGCASPLLRTGLGLGPHSFVVDATDASGNTGAATHSWRIVDRTAPVVTVTGPPTETELHTVQVTFGASEAASFACTLNGVAVTGCASPQTLTGLGLGSYVFEVSATDPSGNTGSSSIAWAVVDRTAPVVTIVAPPAQTESRTVELAFSSSEPATLGCSLNGTPLTGCTSPKTLSGLELGDYLFEVSATDPSGNSGSAGVAWSVVDRTAPTVTITGPPAETEERSAQLVFTASENSSIACTFDGEGVAGCASPIVRSGLGLGPHTLEVQATDSSGNTGSASHSWTIVDRSAPVVTVTGPPAETEERTVDVVFSSSEPATLGCSLNGTPLTGCTSPKTLSGLELGNYVFRVSATDPSGNTGLGSVSWAVVDRTPPVVNLTGPPAETEDRSAELVFSSSESATFACTLDGAAVTPCVSPVSPSGLALGGHTFVVEATDASGNRGVASHNWTIVAAPPPPDTTAPVITLSGPASGTQETNATFTFSVDEPATFRCKLDTAGFDVCSSGISYSGLLPGEHVFRMEAEDAAGNIGTASHTWTIVPPPPPPDTTAPVVTLTGPAGGTQETSATFEFSASEVATFTCSLDGVDVPGCASPLVLDGLSVGEHTFEVVATDTAGNTGNAGHTWTIVAAPPPPDTTPPVITLSGPASGTQETNATFTFSVDEPATFRCKLDTAGFDVCSSGISYSGLLPGEHVFRMEAEDAAGNIGTASHTWTIASPPPPPPPPPSCTGATVTVVASADTWVLESSPTSNYGSDSALKVDTKAGANARALVRFALPAIPSGCTLRDVKLRLHAGSYKEGRTLQALPISSSWSELGVNWTNQPAPTGAAVTTSSGSDYREWDVTSQITSPTGNVSFLVRDTTENGNGVEQAFHSREKGTDNPPRLVVTYG